MAQGFWLSFCAVAIIIFAVLMPGKKLNGTGQPESTAQTRLSNAIKTGLVWGQLQVVIAIGLAPLLLLFYQHVSLVAPVANIIAIPLVGFVAVPIILLGVLFDAVALTSLSSGLFALTDSVLQWFWQGLSWLGGFDGLNYRGSQPNPWLLTTGAIGALLLLAPRGVPARWMGVLWLVPLFVTPSSALEKGTLDVTVLDVGQGLAVVVRTPSHTMLFDTGAKFSESFDAGSAVVLPYFRRQKIKRIDMAVLSHNDNDHTGGMRAIREQLPPEQILTGTLQPDFDSTQCRTGDRWNWDGIEFEVLWPDSNARWSENNASCVIKISNGNNAILLTGDIEAEAEQRLVDIYGEGLKSDVLLIPHHGSNTSSTSGFLDAVQPRVAINSSGYRNRFNHPHDAVTTRLDARGISRLDTQSSGAITVVMDSHGIKTHVYRRQRPRYYF